MPYLVLFLALSQEGSDTSGYLYICASVALLRFCNLLYLFVRKPLLVSRNNPVVSELTYQSQGICIHHTVAYPKEREIFPGAAIWSYSRQLTPPLPKPVKFHANIQLPSVFPPLGLGVVVTPTAAEVIPSGQVVPLVQHLELLLGDVAGAVLRAHDGDAIAAAHARSHARTDDASAFAWADDGRADARLG